MSGVKLPEGWIDAQLGQIIDYGKANKKVLSEVKSSTWVLELEDIEKDSSKLLNQVEMSERPFKSAKNSFKKGDVLYGKLRPYLNKVIVANRDGVCTTEIIPISAEPLCLNKYIFYWLKNSIFLRYVNDVSYGVNMPRLGTSDGNRAPFRLAPFAEQKIIADKLDTLLAQVDSTKARLEQIPQILKRFRQAVLAAAVSGKLTQEWRKQNKISSDWKSVHFIELITKLRSGSGDTPSDNVCGVPILRSSAIRPQIINYEDVRYLSNEEVLNEDNYLKNGDLLFTRLSGSADYVGNCALVKGLTKKYQYPDRLFCARLKDQRNANYLEYFCNSNIFREHIIKSIKSSAGHQRITLDAIRTAQIFIPDYLEQTEIVRRVEQLFAYADGIEKQVQNALERVNNLTQSILAKAFRGELTAQWRAENPDLISGENSAQALLAKIQQQRANTKTAKRGSSKR